MTKFQEDPLYGDGAHYDAHHINYDCDLQFYTKYALNSNGPILELACGTGRLTIPIAQKGLDVTGLDISEEMLKQARMKTKKLGLNIEFIHADCRNFNLGKKFSLIYYPFNSIAHLTKTSDIEACFSCVKHHITDDGIFIVDHFNPCLDILNRNPNEVREATRYPDPYSSEEVVITETLKYDKATQLSHIKWFYKVHTEGEFVHEFCMRVFFPQEFDALMKYNSFDIINKFGDFVESPFQSDSPKQIMVCRKKK